MLRHWWFRPLGLVAAVLVLSLLVPAVAFATTDAYEPDDTRDQAKTISVDGGPQYRGYESGGQDWFAFSAFKGNAYTITGGMPLVAFAFCDVAVYDAGGHWLAGDSFAGDSTNFRLDIAPSADQQIYVRVTTSQSSAPELQYWLSVLEHGPRYLAGTVTKQPGGEPFGGALVSVYRLKYDVFDSLVATATSAVDGTWQASVLLPGEYGVKFSDPNGALLPSIYDGQAYDATYPTHVSVLDSGFEHIDGALRAKSAISGRVLDVQTDKPVGGVRVLLVGDHLRPNVSTLTAEDGSFNFTGLESYHAHQVWISAPDSEWIGFRTEDVPVAPGATSTVDAWVVHVSRVKGCVTDTDGHPIPDIRVEAWQPYNGIWGAVQSAYTDDNGQYTVDRLQAADTKLRFSSDSHQFISDWWKASPGASQGSTFSVETSATYSGMDIVLAHEVDPPMTVPLWSSAWTNQNVTAGFGFNESTGIAWTRYRIGEGEVATYTAPFVITNAGETTIQFRSSDTLGNVETTKTATVRIDRTPPVTTLTALPSNGWLTGTQKLQLSAVDPYGAGLRYTVYTLNGGTASTYVGPVTTREGTTTVQYWSLDRVNNQEAVHTVVVYTDRTVPTITSNDTGQYRDSASIRVSGSDAISGVATIAYRIDDGPLQVASGSETTVTSDVPGNHVFTAVAQDAAGNTSTTYSAAFLVQTSTSAALSASASTIDYGKSVRLTARLLDIKGNPVATKPVVLDRQASTGWVWAGSATTASDGRCSIDQAPRSKTVYRIRFAGGGLTLPAASSSRSVLVRAYLSAPYVPTTSYKGRAFASKGYLKPRHSAGSYPVRLLAYHYEAGRWVCRRTISARASDYSSYSRYTAAVSLPYRGKWRIRAYHAADSANAATYSSYRYTTVK